MSTNYHSTYKYADSLDIAYVRFNDVSPRSRVSQIIYCAAAEIWRRVIRRNRGSLAARWIRFARRTTLVHHYWSLRQSVDKKGLTYIYTEFLRPTTGSPNQFYLMY